MSAPSVSADKVVPPRSPTASAAALRRDKAPASHPAPADTFSLRDALRSRWAAAQTACVTAEVVLWRAPTMLLPRLAPYCTTPLARGALVGACGASWLVFVPIVGLLSTLVKSRWQAAIFEQRAEKFIGAMGARPDLFPDGDLRNDIAAELADEGTYLAQQYTQFFTMAMSSSVQALAVAAQVSTLPLGLPMIGLLAGIVAVTYWSKDVGTGSIDGQSREVREARQQLATTGQQSWDNLVLGNAFHRDRWRTDFDDNARTYFWHLRRGLFGGQIQTILFSLQWMIQSSVTAATSLYSQCFPDKGPLLSTQQNAAVVNMASLITISSEAMPLYRQYRDLCAKRARSDGRLARVRARGALLERMKGEQITVRFGSEEVSGQQCYDDLDCLRAPGLHTIRGQNGAGKSHLLLLAKEHFGDDAMLVPASHSLNFSFERGSSGQNVQRMFEELERDQLLPPVLLLDEWDAHVDDNVRQVLQDKLKTWSVEHAIVQIAHR